MDQELPCNSVAPIPNWLYQSATYMTVVFDNTGCITAYNPLFKHTCGKPGLQQNIRAYLSPAAQAKWLCWQQEIGLAAAPAQPLQLPDTVNGLSLQWEITPLSHDDVAQWFIAIIRQSQVQAGQPVPLDVEHLFHVFVNNSPISSWIADSQGRMVLMNRGFKKFLGLGHADVGKTLWEMFPRHLADEYHANNLRVLETNAVLKIEETSIDKDGRQRDFIVYKFPLSSFDGELLVGGCSIDITERKQAEARVEQTSEQLKEIIFFQSHEMRRPLTNMIGIFNLIETQNIQPGDALYGQMMQALKTCVQQLDHMSREIVGNAGGLIR